MKTSPRERAQSHGIKSLHDHELLSLVIGSGSKTFPVFSLAQQILKTFGGVHGLADASIFDLKTVSGLGLAQASRIAAAIEFGARACNRLPNPRFIRQAEDVFLLMNQTSWNLTQEHFWSLSLTSRNRLIAINHIAIGHLTAVSVHPREFFRPLLVQNAAHCIAVHNHPSGESTPSAEDIQVTDRLRAAGELLGIHLLDHVVVARSEFSSIAEICRETPR